MVARGVRHEERRPLTVPHTRDEATPAGPWVTDSTTDRFLLYAGLYVTLAVLGYAAWLGELPRITHEGSGFTGMLSLLTVLVLFSPHLLATVWLAFGNDALREAMPDGGRRFRRANLLFIALLIPLLLVASQGRGSLLIVFGLIGLMDAFHFTAQDRGFLSVYRHRVGQGEPFARRDNPPDALRDGLDRAQHPGGPRRGLLDRHRARGPDVAGDPADLALHQLSRRPGASSSLDVLQGELRRPEGPHWPKLAFLLSALATYALVPVTPILGYLASRVHHGASYLGLSRHMVRRLDAAGRFRGRLFPRLASSHLAVYVTGMGLLAMPVSVAMAMTGHLDTAHLAGGLVLGVNFHHYFVDAFIWRFRRPEVRAGVAAYI